ncbi:MAG: ABC transporter permease subunit [Lentilitoribacter sp.]
MLKPQLSIKKSHSLDFAESKKYKFFQNRLAVLGLIIVVFNVLIAVLADFVAPHSPVEQFRSDFLTAPAWQKNGDWRFILGTDGLGRDILSRLIYGARHSFAIGFLAVILSMFVGTTVGVLSGYIGGIIDAIIMRVTDLYLALPGLLLVLVLLTIFTPSLASITIAIAAALVPHFIKIARALAIREKVKGYFIASRSIGASHLRLMFLVVLPNCFAPLIVQSALSFSAAITDIAAIGFLGMGVAPPTPEWGTMLSESREFIFIAPWVIWAPCSVLILTVIAINLLTDGLKEIFDPK